MKVLKGFPKENYKDKIEIYYFLAFNEDYSELKYTWRVTGWKVIGIDALYVGMSPGYRFNIENMKEFDITDKIRDVLKKYEYFNKVKIDTNNMKMGIKEER